MVAPLCPSACLSVSWSCDLEQPESSPLQESWVSAARHPSALRNALSSLGPSVVPFVEKLLHKALLNGLDLGMNVPVEACPA